MFCRLAGISVVFGVIATAAGSPSSAAGPTRDVWALTTPVEPSIPNIKGDPHPAISPVRQSRGEPKPPTPEETPNAPLPPALWPGLMLLAILGAAKLAIQATRKTARR